MQHLSLFVMYVPFITPFPCNLTVSCWMLQCLEVQEESQLNKITRDSAKITAEQVHGLMSQVVYPLQEVILPAFSVSLQTYYIVTLNNIYVPIF